MNKNTLSKYEIGYTALETSHDTRFGNERTLRARLVRADGSGDRELGAHLVTSAEHWTQLAGWMTDRQAIIQSGRQSQEMADVEQARQTFIVTENSRWLDVWLIDPESGRSENPCEPERVSQYNLHIREWPNRPHDLALEVVTDGSGRLYRMDRNGRNKRPLNVAEGYCYGLAISPDGTRAAWHEDYQVIVARSDGQDITTIDTGRPFNFGPTWSPDGKWILFISGKANLVPAIYLADSSDLSVRRISGRTGYLGVGTIMDAGDWHVGGTDMCCWAPDSRGIYFTARARDGNVELFRYSLGTRRRRRLTHSPPGSVMTHPDLSPDGLWVATTGLVDGARNIFVTSLSGESRQVTFYPRGCGAIHAKWRPFDSV